MQDGTGAPRKREQLPNTAPGVKPRAGGGSGMVGALCTAAVLSLATVVRGDFRVKFEVQVRSGTKEFTVLVHEDWAPSMPPPARTPD